MNLKRFIAETFFPPRCVACGKVIKGMAYGFCRGCVTDLPETGEKNLFTIPYVSLYAPYYYEGAIRRALIRFKFNGKKQYAPFFAVYMAECVREIALYIDAVTFVPLAEKGRRKRGYDQAEELAVAVAAELGKPLVSSLVKLRETKKQSGLRRAQRVGNVLGAYAAADVGEGARLLLVDDVATTGSTMSEAAKTLLSAGAGNVVGLCAAKTEKFDRGKRVKRLPSDKTSFVRR